mmetsp:Transcript_26675/g.57355  ORF Transcript_26675/g.57355 Transcript_26675/m.57355 type:complete len:267 (-) Transcript_26675:1409-2209(-)
MDALLVKSISIAEIFLAGLEEVAICELVTLFSLLGALISKSSSSLLSSSLLSSSKSTMNAFAGFSVSSSDLFSCAIPMLDDRRGLSSPLFSSVPSFFTSPTSSGFTSFSTFSFAILLKVTLSSLSASFAMFSSRFIRKRSIKPTRSSMRFMRNSSRLVSKRAAMASARCLSSSEIFGPESCSSSSFSSPSSPLTSLPLLLPFFAPPSPSSSSSSSAKWPSSSLRILASSIRRARALACRSFKCLDSLPLLDLDRDALFDLVGGASS